MFNLQTVQDRENLSEVYNFTSREYDQIGGGNYKKFKPVALYSYKAVINKIAKLYQVQGEFSTNDNQRLNAAILQYTNQFDKKQVKQYLNVVKKYDKKSKQKLLVIIENNQPEFNSLLIEFLISCDQIRNYTIFPVGKIVGNRTLLQKKASTYSNDPVAFFQGLKTEYITNDEFKLKLNGLYSIIDYDHFLQRLTIENEIFDQQTLNNCSDHQQLSTYLINGLNILNKRQIQFNDKYSKTAMYQEYIDRSLVMKLQEHDPSNKITLLKLVIFMSGIMVSAIPLLTIFEDYKGNVVVGLGLTICGYIIMKIGSRFLAYIQTKTVIDSWLKLIISYEPILFGFGVAAIGIVLVPYLAFLAIGLGVFECFDR